MITKIKSIEDIIEHAESCKSDARRDARIFSHYKRRLLALADGKPLRWVCVQYLCSFPGYLAIRHGCGAYGGGREIDLQQYRYITCCKSLGAAESAARLHSTRECEEVRA